MKCVISGGNVRVLAKAIHMLAKVGDEMYVHPQQDSISFRTVNMAKSAYSQFTLRKSFFSYYSLEDLEEEDAQKCKISMRSAITVFKSAQMLDKQVETCHIYLEIDACNLIFILKYRNGINKSHLSPILDSEKLQASYNKNGMVNEVTTRARILANALQNFQQNLVEITLEVTPQKLLLRNYVDNASAMPNTTRTQLVLGVREFDRYKVNNETTITFCMKEFRAMLMFSETVGVPVSIYFETAGKPMLFSLTSQGFEVNLLLSTLNLDTDSQSDVFVVDRPIQSTRKKTKSTSKWRKKSSSRVNNKPITLAMNSINDTSKIEQAENNTNKTLEQIGNVSVEVKNDNLKNIVPERNQSKSSKLKQSHLSVLNPASTSSSLDSKISDNRRKVVNSVFSTIAKRKSRNEERLLDKEKTVAIDVEDDVSSSPVRQAAKKARTVFQKCFQTTFDSRMLPGHEVVLVEDSDDCISD